MSAIGHEWQSQPVLGRLCVPIYYEDTDFTGYVFHANYVKYFDRAREQVLGGCLLKQMFAEGCHFVVARLEVHFARPAAYGDTLIITSRTRASSSPRLVFFHEVFNADSTPEAVIGTGLIELVAVNARGRPTRTPRQVLALLAARAEVFAAQQKERGQQW